MGLPVGAFQLTTGDEFTINQTFGLPHGIDPEASQITVELGSLSVSAPYTVTRLPAAEMVRAVVLDSEVQRDWLRIRVAVQVRDEHLNPATGSGRVYIQAVQGSGLRDVSASCRPDSTRGTCVATVTVTPSWLDGGDITVSYGLAMNTLQMHPSRVIPRPYTELSFENNLIVLVPDRPVQASDSFDIEVFARAEQDLESAKFTIFMEDSSQVEVIQLRGSNEATWSYQFSSRSDGFTVVINRKPGVTAITQSPQELQALVTAEMRVVSSAAAGPVRLQLHVKEMNAPNAVNPGGQLIPDGGFAFGHVYGPNANINSAGHFQIVADEMVGLFSMISTGQGSFLNVAPITRQSRSLQVDSYEAHRYGQQLRQQLSASCSTTAGNAPFELGASPCTVSFVPSITTGSADTVIESTYGGFTALVSLRVWSPVLPLDLSTDTTTLAPIALRPRGTAMVSSDCSLTYLWSNLKASARFTLGDGGTSVTYDVTELVSPNLQSSDSAVVTVSTANARFVGQSPGSATLGFGVDASALGSLSITVRSQAAPMHIVSFDIGVFAGIELELGRSSMIPGSDQQAFARLVQANMTQEGLDAAHYIVSSMVIADPTEGSEYFREVTDQPGIQYSSSNTAVATVMSDGARLVATGSGLTDITAVWNNTANCDFFVGTEDTLLSIGSASVVVELPAATSVYFTDQNDNSLTSIKLTNENDAAFHAGSAVNEQQIGVKCVYPDYERDLTYDDRTEFTYEDAASSQLFTIAECSQGSGLCIQARPGVSGTGGVRVRFDHESVALAITVEIIQGTQLVLLSSPYPSWGGSDTINKIALFQIGSTGEFQQALISAILQQSDGTAVPVTAYNGVVFDGTTLSTSGSFEIRQRGSSTIYSPTEPGTVTITATMNGITSTALSLTVSDDVVDIDSIISVHVSRSQQNTVSGRRGARYETVFGVTMNDGTQISQSAMFSDYGSDFRSRLVRFSSNDVQSLSINASTGWLELHENTAEQVSIQVTSFDNPNVHSSDGVFCNLRAESLDVDIASSQRQISRNGALDAIAAGDMVDIKIYFTSGGSAVGALTLELEFDSSLLAFVSVAAGEDDNTWTDPVAGEVKSDDPNVVRFGGVTTNAAAGNDWHFATLRFQSTGVDGVAIFGGYMVEVADGSAIDLRDPYTPFVAGAGVALIIGDGQARRRRAEHWQPSSQLRLTRRAVGCADPLLGDVNQDCQLSSKDALLTAKYSLVNDDQTAAATFLLDQMITHSVNVSVNAMDADFNSRVDTRDTSVLLYILFGGLRFVGAPELVVKAPLLGNTTCQVTIAVDVQQNSGDGLYGTDPSRSAKTKIVLLITGDASLSGQVQGLGWSGTSLSVPPSAGVRFVGYVPTRHIPGTSTYVAEGDAVLGAQFGVSVIQIVDIANVWSVPFDGQYMSVGSPYPLENRTENPEQSLVLNLDVGLSNTVPFSYGVSFAPMQTFWIDRTHPMCVTGSPSVAPTDLPSMSPTHGPSVSENLVLSLPPLLIDDLPEVIMVYTFSTARPSAFLKTLFRFSNPDELPDGVPRNVLSLMTPISGNNGDVTVNLNFTSWRIVTGLSGHFEMEVRASIIPSEEEAQ